MAIGPSYKSDDELIKRLQIVIRDSASTQDDLVRVDADAREGRNLVAELALRIHSEPDKWGVGPIPAEVRDDVAADTLMSLLLAAPGFRGQQPVAQWFAAHALSRSEDLLGVYEQPMAAGDNPAASRGNGNGSGAMKDDGKLPPVFTDGLWEGFEESHPRDAFVLRLRYMLKRSPDDMAEMLEAPSPRAVSMRLNRARDRFRAFCQKAGTDVRATEQMLHELGEGRKR